MYSLLKTLENKDHEFLGPNYWGIKQACLVLPKSKIMKIFYIIIHAFVNLFVISQYVELYVIRSDLDLVLTNLRISMLSVVCVAKVNTFILWQDDWRDVLNYVSAADKYERNNADKTRIEIILKYTKYCRHLTYFYWALTFVTFLTTSSTPLMRYFSSPAFRDGFHNGTELFPHIFSSWMPFDKYHSPGNWMTVIWHTLLCFYGATIMAAYDTCVVVIMVFFGGKTDLLRERCKQIFSRCKTGADADFRDTIRQLHQLHMGLRKYSRMFNSLLSPVMFVYVVMSSLMLCASAYQLTSVTNAAQKLLMAEYLIFGIAQLFMFCWHSNGVLVKNEHLSFGTYASNWLTASVKQRKDLQILTEQLRMNTVFTAGPFTKLTVPTFLTILKGAYSYYTLLRK